jgi:hypothetical protein
MPSAKRCITLIFTVLVMGPDMGIKARATPKRIRKIIPAMIRAATCWVFKSSKNLI